jgi:hypothetical protein
MELKYHGETCTVGGGEAEHSFAPSTLLDDLREQADDAKALMDSAWLEADDCIRRAGEAEDVYANCLEQIRQLEKEQSSNV